MKKLTVSGKEVNLDLTLGAIREYKKLTGKELEQITSVSDISEFLFCVAKSTARRDGVDFKFSIEEFLDNLSLDAIKVFTELMEDEGLKAGDGGSPSKKKELK
jgi:hypothetical protein